MATKLLLSLLLSILTASTVSAKQFNVYLLLQAMSSQDSIYRQSFTDPQVCYDRLISADNDSSYQLNRQEYVKYARLMAPPPYLQPITRFQDLPLALQSTYNALSCLCPGSSKTNCCDDMLNINGAGGDADANEKNDLFLICSLTRLAIDYVVEGSGAPTIAPEPTGSPTNIPSSRPTMVPTMAPSRNPTPEPSTFPTNMPSTLPSAVPSLSPSIPPEPTTSGVPTISLAPTDLPRVAVEYRVGVQNGVYTPAEYEALLEQAMDSLAPEILLGVDNTSMATVRLPTQIDEYLQDGTLDLSVNVCALYHCLLG